MSEFEHSSPIISGIQEQEFQGHGTRKPLYQALEQSIGRPLLSFFTSFVHQTSINQEDVDAIESILQSMDLSKGLALLISSPGGDPIAAERIIDVCRRYSSTGEYLTIVPSRAKSAATMICMGSSLIKMGPASELGPIDPQLVMREDGVEKRYSVWSLVEGYEELFNQAQAATGRLEPFLQQLNHYDFREIQKYKQVIDLTDDIAVKALSAGMLTGKTDDEIKACIKLFADPKETKSHSRAIKAQEARDCGLNIEEFDVGSELWKQVYELYLRVHNVTKKQFAKVIENSETSLAIPA